MAQEKHDLSKIKKVRTKYDNLVQIGNYFYVDFFKKGRGHLQKSTGETSITRANEIKTDMINEFLGKKARKIHSQYLMDELFPKFIAERSQELRESTIRSMNEQWRLYLNDIFGNRSPHEAEDLWPEFLSMMALKDLRVFNSRKYLMVFLNWCVDKGYLDRVPKLVNPDEDAEPGRVYTIAEMRAMKEAAREDSDDFYLCFMMSATMMTRVNENNIPWDRVELTGKFPRINLRKEDTKTKKARSFIISDECLDLLKERKKASTSPFIFHVVGDPSRKKARDWYNKSWRRTKKAAGITGVAHFHHIRHTCLTEAFKKSVNPLLICDYAGLDIKVAQKVYLHFKPEDTKHVVSPLGSLD